MLAHFVGDFVLQFDKLHALKFKNASGLLLHILVVIGCFAAFCWPYLGWLDLWLFLVFIGITHFIQDWAKIKFTTQSKHGLLFFVLDQILHILFISMIFLTNLQNIRPPFNKSGNIFLNLYSSNALIVYLTAIIVASYAAHYIILICKKDYLKQENAVSPFEKKYGFIERIIIVSAFFAGNLWLLLIPFILILRPLIFKTMQDKLSISDQFGSRTEIVLSGTASILTGLIFYTFI